MVVVVEGGSTKFNVKHQGKDIHHPPSTIYKWPLSDLPRSTLCPSLSLSFTKSMNFCYLLEEPKEVCHDREETQNLQQNCCNPYSCIFLYFPYIILWCWVFSFISVIVKKYKNIIKKFDTFKLFSEYDWTWTIG